MFPKPDLSDRVYQDHSTPDHPQTDIGWAEGVFSDGRPYRIESFRDEDGMALKYAFSSQGLEEHTRFKLLALVLKERLITFANRDDIRYSSFAAFVDASGNAMWALYVSLDIEGRALAKSIVQLKPFFPRQPAANAISTSNAGTPASLNYPKPDRSDQTFKGFKTAEEPSLDIGWNEGWLSDSRPYHLECWAEDQATANTYFMSTMGMEAMTDEQFASFLVHEGLLEFTSDKRYVDASPWVDPNGNDMWSVNVVVGDDSATYVRDLIPLRRYAFNALRTASV